MKCTVCGSEWYIIEPVRCPFCGVTLSQKTEREILRKSMPEQRCPICDKAPLTGGICPECGYDQSCDAETFGTISAVLEAHRKTLAGQKREYEEKILKTPQKLLQQTEQATVQENYRLAWERIYEAATQGDASAQNKLGDCYCFGKGVVQDNSKATEWYLKAAGQGHIGAQYRLGNCYYYGKGVAQDYAQAAAWYRKAAEYGHASAQNSLGDCYYYGKGVLQSDSKAVEWYRKAAEQGDICAQNNLGNCYYYGKDYGKAAQWYRKAAEQGDICAQNNLGNCYYYDKDYGKAVECYRKAAEQGNASAQYNLGNCYYDGKGVLRDVVAAADYYLLAKKQGNSNAEAAYSQLLTEASFFDRKKLAKHGHKLM